MARCDAAGPVLDGVGRDDSGLVIARRCVDEKCFVALAAVGEKDGKGSDLDFAPVGCGSIEPRGVGAGEEVGI